MSNVVPLRKRSPSFYSVRRAGSTWAVVLMTPTPTGHLCTALCHFQVRKDAVAYGMETAARALLPFREPRGSRR